MTTAKTTRPHRTAGAAFVALAALAICSGCWAQPDAGAGNPAADEARTVLITGANRGIGLELARQYSGAGWNVLGTARNPDGARELTALGATVLQLDVTDQASVERLARDLDNRSLDVLINNAGILPSRRGLDDFDIDDFNRAIAVNTVGPVRVTRAVLPNLRAGRLKAIVNITSQLGSIAGNTGGGFYGYRESKAALNMFTKSLAADLGPDGFVCIVLHPGWVQTDMGGQNAPLTAEDSVRGIRRIVDGLSASDNGTFRTYDGAPIDW